MMMRTSEKLNWPDLVQEVVVAHGAVPLDSTHHEVLNVDHACARHLHPDHVETFAGQVVTRYKGSVLTLSERAGLTGQGGGEEEEEEVQRAGQGG